MTINTVFFFFLFYYTASWNNAAIKATVSQPLCQGDVGYGATVNSPSFSSLYILQLSSKKAFSENWWQFGIYWIPVDKNTLSEVLGMIVLCVLSNPGNCCLVLPTSLLCLEPPSSAGVCPGGSEGRGLCPCPSARGSPARGKFWAVQGPGSTLRAGALCRDQHLQPQGDNSVENTMGGWVLCSSESLTFGIFRDNPLLVIPWKRAE